MYLDAKNAYLTDILFISEQRKDLIQENGLQGAPDLAIKILLPDTANYDLEEKMEMYAGNGVQEYWIIAPHEKREGYWLVVNEYQLMADEMGIVTSKNLKKKFKF